MAFRLILVNSHVRFRKELKRVLEAQPGLSVVGEAEDFQELVTCIDSLAPDLIVIDIFGPKFGGIQAIHEIKNVNSDIRILVLTMYEEVDHMSTSLASGADGYLLKENAFEDIPAALESIRRGRKCVSPALDRRAPKIQAKAMKEPERRMVPWSHLEMVSLNNSLGIHDA